MNVVIQPFSAPKAGARHATCTTRSPQAPETVQNLRGVVLASDGDWNEGQPPVEAAARLRLKGIPVFAVPVGSPTRLPDVELLEPRRADVRHRRQVGAHSVHDRELAAARATSPRSR